MQSSYYTRTPEGSEYAQLCRDLDGEQVLLDPAQLAGDSPYVDIGVSLVSPDERLLAYSVDLTGEEIFALAFRDLVSLTDLPDRVPRSYYGGAWAADSATFFYTVHDEAYRPYQVWRHRVGTPTTEDRLVLTEPDERFCLDVWATRSGDLVVIESASRDTSEVWLVDAHSPTGHARSVLPRRPGVTYQVEHARTPDGGVLVMLTDDGARESRLLVAPVTAGSAGDGTQWHELVGGDPATRLGEVDAFASHLVVSLRRDGYPLLRVLRFDGTQLHDICCQFPAGQIRLGRNELFESDTVTVVEDSFVQPATWTDVDLATGARTVRHRQVVPGYKPDDYVTERLAIPAGGVHVPATLVRHRDTPLDGTAPALLWGYGAYESCDDPAFDPALPSLLDRGVVYVQTHPRGGGERGHGWWLAGRLQHKQHTFSDHVAVADYLAGQAVVDGSRIATRGLSAGGLLMGAVLSQRPDRWRAVVAEVPFVDVVTTMLDPAVPLTANEWDEWGDPRRPEDFAWMLAYSPYDNLPPAGGRPDLLVTGAVHDPRVMVWEPAKWVAALRATDPEWSPRCVFRCEIGEGAHTGPSGRYATLAYEAEIYAWILDRLTPALTSGADP